MHFIRCLLPVALLTLSFTIPALASTTTTTSMTPYDPFHAISIHAPKSPDEPMCCLRPLTPEHVADDLFLSFEDWKSRRSSESHPKDSAVTPADVPSGEPSVEASPSLDTSGVSGAQDTPDVQPSEPVSPHFRVPLTDRFNYASLDCSARVHTAHRSAKSASNILSSKRDRYMLSPCASERQFVVVELCEDIRIDTVQLANYEFFSGVFKEFTVSVAKTYATDAGGWTVAGTYTGKNMRGVQSFHPPTSLGDFYRFIRIDFHSHYGNEYYCPISLLRVYGLTHLEQWKWDTWEAESRAKLEQSPPVVPSIAPAEVGQEPPQPAQSPQVVYDATTATVDSVPAKTHAHVNATVPPPEEDGANRHSKDIARSTPSTPNASPVSQSSDSVDSDRSRKNLFGDATHPENHTHASASSPTPSSSSVSVSVPVVNSSLSLISEVSSPRSSVTVSLSSSASSSTPPIISLSPAIAPHMPSTGESIYRTIMNRLTALEANTTLYARYVEEQTAGVREMLRRLGEDVGRLEGIGRAQAHLYQRSVSDFEKQRRRMEVEQRELITQVNYLAEEITLEKRLGIAQLFLLLAVLVFLSLTRGSRSDLPTSQSATLRKVGVPGAVSMKEWGRRNLSFSGDWVSRLRSRSRTPSNGETTPIQHASIRNGDPVAFPSASRGHEQPISRGKAPQKPRLAVHATPTHNPVVRRPWSSARPRTPSIRNSPRTHHSNYARAGPATPTSGARPIIQRSSSHSSAGTVGVGAGASVMVGPVPRSARRWAHSAHIHEVRRTGTNSATPGEQEDNLRVDVLEADGVSGLIAEGGLRGHVSPLRISTAGKVVEDDAADGGADVWLDTDADGSDGDWAPAHGREEADGGEEW